jgi:hypothetical protein
VSLGVFWHENVQSGSHPEPAMLFAVPQSHCSPVSTFPSPHVPPEHVPFVHWPVPSHTVPLVAGVLTQCCPLAPLTVTGVHVFVPAQTSIDWGQELLGVIVHENLQVISHPVPAPLPDPKSQSFPSPGTSSPSPQ